MAYINGKQIMNAVAILGELDTEFSATSKNVVANSTIANNVGNALKGAASGEVVTVNDISPIEHITKAWVHGKNLLNIDFETKTHNGVTFTNNGDGSFTINGTATTAFGFVICNALVLPIGTYTLTIEDVLPQGLNIYTIGNGETINFIYGANGKNIGTITLETDCTRLRLWIAAGCVFDNFVLRPQLEAGDTATAYTPYVKPSAIKVTEETTGATYTPDDNGVCNVVSVSPTMTLSTDTNGATIDLEYNRDINAVIADIYSHLT